MMQDAQAERPTQTFVLIDDDKFSARFFERQLRQCAAQRIDVKVEWHSTATAGLIAIQRLARSGQLHKLPDLVVLDIKSTSSANANFLRESAGALAKSGVKAVAFVSANTPEVKRQIAECGAVAVYERHSDLTKYREELESLLALSAQVKRAA